MYTPKTLELIESMENTESTESTENSIAATVSAERRSGAGRACFLFSSLLWGRVKSLGRPGILGCFRSFIFPQNSD